MAKKAKKTKKPVSDWELLRERIDALTGAAIDESWKGGGDPEDIPVLESDLEQAKARLEAQLEKMEQEYKRV